MKARDFSSARFTAISTSNLPVRHRAVSLDEIGKRIGNSSVFRFDIGKHADVLKYFEENRFQIRKQFRNEQAYLSYAMMKKGILKYWDKKWCVSFKRHCLKKFPINYFKAPELPKDAKILIFHGHPNPEEAFKGFTSKFGFRHVKPTLWLNDFWKV